MNEALSLAQRQQERGHEAWSLRLLGEIASRRDPRDAETAETYYREALTWPTSWACVPSLPTVISISVSCCGRCPGRSKLDSI